MKFFNYSEQAKTHLAELFNIQRKTNHSNVSRSGFISWDGLYVAQDNSRELTGENSISHSLNTLAKFWREDVLEHMTRETTLDEFKTIFQQNKEPRYDLWLDTRTKAQQNYCEQQQIPKQFRTSKEARLYYKEMGLPNYRALWSNEALLEVVDGIESYPLARQHELNLLPLTIDYFTKIAKHWHMHPLNRARISSKTSLTSAALEAIGSQWLTPHPSYKELLAENPNRNLSSSHKRTSRIYGNPSHEPIRLIYPADDPRSTIYQIKEKMRLAIEENKNQSK